MPMTPEEYIATRKRWEEMQREFAKNDPESQRRKKVMGDHIKAQHAKGIITDETLRKWMEGQISIAGMKLLVGIVVTALFKGQFLLWILFFILYVAKVKETKKQAWAKEMEQCKYYYEDD